MINYIFGFMYYERTKLDWLSNSMKMFTTAVNDHMASPSHPSGVLF